MKHKKLKTCAVLLLGLGLQATQAETALFVKQKVGTNTPFNMSTLKSLTFDSGNVLVNLKDAPTSSFIRTNVQYINFGVNNTTVLFPENGEQNSKQFVYFNRKQDILNIVCGNENSENLQLEIFTIDGKMAIKTLLYNNINSVSVENLAPGIYICRVMNGNRILTQKFIK